jgi:hypothetical protein
VIEFIDTIFTKLGTIGNYSAVADLHTLQFTVTHALRFSVFTSRILATDLSQSHCNFKSYMESSFRNLIPCLSLFCSCQFWRLDSLQILCFQAHIPAGWHPETRLSTPCCSTEFFFTTTSYEPHGKRRLLLSRIVLGVFTESLPSNGYTRHNSSQFTWDSCCYIITCLWCLSWQCRCAT